MTTDNRTNEQIVAEALREGVHVAGGGRSHLAAADVTYALGKAGRLVAAQGAAPQAEPETVDEEQIVATVLAELEEHRATGETGGWGTTFHRHGLSNEIHRGVDDCGRGTGKPVYVFDPDFLEEHDEWVVQATLRAVSDVAPVLPSSTCQHNMVSYTDSVSEKREHFCSLCGYEPSSTVDEDALAEVIESHVLGEPNGGTASWAWVNCSCGYRIEIAGVTREHVVALGRKHQARAVVAYLRGES